MIRARVWIPVALFVMFVASKPAVLESFAEAKSAHNLIPKFFKSLDKAFEFFEKKFDQVNLDAIFGLRISEGRKKL